MEMKRGIQGSEDEGGGVDRRRERIGGRKEGWIRDVWNVEEGGARIGYREIC
jgi:hypothetical protein